MIHRQLHQQGARTVVGASAIVIAILLPTNIPIIPAVLGAALAYDGPNSRGVVWTTGFLVVVELLFALDIGMLSLSYLVAAVFLSLLGRLVAIAPWATADGWAIADFLRTTVVSLVAAVVIMVGSVLVGTLYGDGLTVQRAFAHLAPERLGPLVLVIVIGLLILRRIDMPLRRRIRFGA